MRQLKITKQITNRENRSLEKYLQEIGSVSLITADEEVELAVRIRNGERLALERLVNANLRFVVSVSKQYQNQGLTLGDLINEGNLGLIKAAQRFDETRGFKFISYAVWWIRQSILQAIAEQARIVRLPLNRVGALSRISKAMADLEQKYEREPTVEELSEVLDLDIESIRDMLKSNSRHVSMDAPLVNGEENTLLAVLEDADQPGPDSGLISESLCDEIGRALSHLPQRERDVLRYFYGIGGCTPLSLEEIAENLTLTRERVRQLKEKAIKRLKSTSRSNRLQAYLA
jgi:RNA polymerase primary sigma factor